MTKTPRRKPGYLATITAIAASILLHAPMRRKMMAVLCFATVLLAGIGLFTRHTIEQHPIAHLALWIAVCFLCFASFLLALYDFLILMRRYRKL